MRNEEAVRKGELREIMIRPLEGAGEARECARMMVESEPWITLQRGFDGALKLITDKTKEVYVACAEKALVGHIVVNMEGPFAGYIQALVVAPERRGRRIGERLLKFAEERIFKDSPNVFLCVSGFNKRAQKFYGRLGYERIGELRNYVIAGESEFLMRKTTGPKDDFRPVAAPQL